MTRQKPHHLRYKYLNRLSFGLFFVSLITLYLNVTPLPQHHIFFFGFVTMYIAQSIPIVVLTILILGSATAPSEYSTSRIVGLASHRHKKNVSEGPTKMAKIYLFIALLLYLPASVLPPSVSLRLLKMATTPAASPDFSPSPTHPGSSFLPAEPLHRHVPVHADVKTTPLLDNCLDFPIFYGYASFMDIFLFASVLSMFFWFLFIRLEFARVKERCIWEMVCKVQDTFGFLRGTESNLGHRDGEEENEADAGAEEGVAA
jgi:hypothetical protein